MVGSFSSYARRYSWCVAERSPSRRPYSLAIISTYTAQPLSASRYGCFAGRAGGGSFSNSTGTACCSRKGSVAVSYTHLDVYKRQDLYVAAEVVDVLQLAPGRLHGFADQRRGLQRIIQSLPTFGQAVLQ